MRSVRKGGVEEEFAAELVADEKEFLTRLVENGEGERAAKLFEIRILLIINTEDKFRNGCFGREAECLAEVAAVGQVAMKGADGGFRCADGASHEAPIIAMQHVGGRRHGRRVEFEGRVAQMKIAVKGHTRDLEAFVFVTYQ